MTCRAKRRRRTGALRILLSDPKRALTAFGERMQPVAPVEPQQLAKLIADLESNAFAARKKAAGELEKIGDLAETNLRELLKGQPAPDVRQQVDGLLQKLDGPNLSGDRLRAVRAVGALEQIGTEDARNLLAKLAQGVPAALATKEAKASLARLEKRIGTPAVQ